jgi:hypothetical protein
MINRLGTRPMVTRAARWAGSESVTPSQQTWMVTQAQFIPASRHTNDNE